MINKLLGMVSPDISIDLGTANTLIFRRGQGIVLNEPSVVAISGRGQQKRVLAVGRDAKRMLGRTPDSVQALRPLKGGVIADFTVTEEMLRQMIRKVLGRSWGLASRMVICVPYGATQVERRAIRESGLAAGAREVYLIEEPMAAAIGANIKVTDAEGSMVVDIGGGTSEIAVISYGGIVYSESVRVGGDRLEEAIVQHIRRKYGMAIGTPTAEAIKINIGSVYPLEEEMAMEVKGLDMKRGIPSTISITSQEIREALKDCADEITNGVHRCLENTPPEMAADLVDRGIVLTGGGALVRGMDQLIHKTTSLPCTVAAEPLNCVAFGAGKVLDEMDVLKEVLFEE